MKLKFKNNAQGMVFAAMPLVIALGLAGCAAPAPPMPSNQSRLPSANNPVASTPAPDAASNSRRGGYYKDDGPGTNPPDIALIADATPKFETPIPRANRPYVVFGQTYAPMTALTTFKQRGMASWYGRKFHGQKTSIGDVYDMYAMTAAHPTLPLPSYVRVTNTRNGKQVVVRVNDRGPFLNQRIIDLSFTAAAKLGYVNAGSAEVEVELITRFDDAPVQVAQAPAATPQAPAAVPSAPAPQTAPEKNEIPERLSLETIITAPVTPPSAPSNEIQTSGARTIYLQLGAFSSQESADVARDRMKSQLDDVTIDGVKEPMLVVRDAGFFKIHFGPFLNSDSAANAAEKIRQQTQFRPFAVRRPAS